MRTTSFFLGADSLQPRTRSREPRSCAGRLVLLAQPRSDIEPEQRLYKTFRETSSPKSGGLELIAFLFFGVLGSGATLYCGAELLHLVDSGALQHTVQTLLSNDGRGTHAFRNVGSKVGRLQAAVAPAGVDRFLERLSPFSIPDDMKQIIDLSAKFGITIATSNENN